MWTDPRLLGALFAQGQRLLAALSILSHVVFTSDNGTTHPAGKNPRFGTGGVDSDFFNSTAGLRGYKGSVYEGGLRVPLIVRLPGRIQAGAVNDFKAVRQRLKTPQPGAWELYDLKSDPNEQNDLAGQRPELIAKAEAILRDQVHENPVFPVPIPGLRPKNPTAP